MLYKGTIMSRNNRKRKIKRKARNRFKEQERKTPSGDGYRSRGHLKLSSRGHTLMELEFIGPVLPFVPEKESPDLAGSTLADWLGQSLSSKSVDSEQ